MVEIIDYQDKYQKYFKTLNLEWIQKFFTIEAADEYILSNPRKAILDQDGFIFFAKHGSEIVGTCALQKVDNKTYELAKMAVNEMYQNLGIGRMLMDKAIKKAKEMKLDKLILYSSTRLTTALNMYLKYGFKYVSKDDHPTKRADVKMELSLKKPNIEILFIIFLLVGFTNLSQAQKPCVAFSFDDGNPGDILTYKGVTWNNMIRDQLSQHKIKTVWFVAANKIDNKAGKRLLHQWDSAGHLVANHTYTHLNYSKPSISCGQFISDILKCDSLINGYQNYRKIFRFPVLKEGNTIAKRDSIRTWLLENEYKQGWVTIDASDWYINSRLIKRLKKKTQMPTSALFVISF